MRLKFTIVLILFVIVANGQSIKSPSEFLGYELGTQFTYHHKTVEYFKYIADNSPSVSFQQYGTSYEGRPLIVCFVSNPDNLDMLETLRTNNLKNIGLLEGEATEKQLPFIWLSYNVHGNESVGMETSMKVLYILATEGYKDSDKWLRDGVIVIDPCQNPDGRDRYTNEYRSRQSLNTNPDPSDWSHSSGWPGSRSNHYYFDLNRDWVWQTQSETVQKIEFYNRYMPHVHADFHEMGPDSPFFFAPGADPWHEVITPWQHEFHKQAGIENAKLFDGKDRLYFTKESFDLFCPSFGDTWPLFNGAMGFTYEQGGGGSAGLALESETGDTLTLTERIDGHFMASIATLVTSYNNKEKLISEFNKFFTSGVSKNLFEYESVIIKGSNENSALNDFLNHLKRNQIRFSFASSVGKSFEGFEYLSNKKGKVTIEEGDILISAYQPQAHLVKVMFEPDSKFTDSLSYDLTAWALPYVYNLKAFALNEKLKASDSAFNIAPVNNEESSNGVYAFLARGTGFNELKLMAGLYTKKVNIRYAQKTFTLGGVEYPRGALIIAKGDNKHLGAGFDKIIISEANRNQVKLESVKTGLSEKGIDLGSNYTTLNKRPEVALIGGEGSSAGSFGQLWYFFERELLYQVTIIEANDLPGADLSSFDVIILPSGSYSRAKEKLLEFVTGGGRLVAFERAVSLFASEKTTKLFEVVELRKKEMEAAEVKKKTTDATLLKRYENSRRESLSGRSANSIYRVKLDDSHPYAFGLGSEWFIIKRAENYPYLKTGNNIGYITENEPVSGFAGTKFMKEVENTLIIGSERVGRGEIVYITEDPYFRGFWKSGRILLGNVVLR